jgi:DNA-binding MarR family transcriptional regulator
VADDGSRRGGARDADQRWADLADLVLVIAREIKFRGYTDERALLLSQSEATVMRYLHQEESAAPSHIATSTGLQRSNLSTVLRTLEEKGLVERRPDPNDRRGVIVHRTEHGKTNYALVRREWAAAVSSAAGDDTTQLDAALTLLTAVKMGLLEMRPLTPVARPEP